MSGHLSFAQSPTNSPSVLRNTGTGLTVWSWSCALHVAPADPTSKAGTAHDHSEGGSWTSLMLH